eukprot:GHVU01208995.1.p1 GENE.GHVU01208995.1~~GHVU01208995.1.p1  ORF type:complete len:267 (+),score=50.89 GHVU01208995.1:169-969(+)
MLHDNSAASPDSSAAGPHHQWRRTVRSCPHFFHPACIAAAMEATGGGFECPCAHFFSSPEYLEGPAASRTLTQASLKLIKEFVQASVCAAKLEIAAQWDWQRQSAAIIATTNSHHQRLPTSPEPATEHAWRHAAAMGAAANPISRAIVAAVDPALIRVNSDAHMEVPKSSRWLRPPPRVVVDLPAAMLVVGAAHHDAPASASASPEQQQQQQEHPGGGRFSNQTAPQVQSTTTLLLLLQLLLLLLLLQLLQLLLLLQLMLLLRQVV